MMMRFTVRIPTLAALVSWRLLSADPLRAVPSETVVEPADAPQAGAEPDAMSTYRVPAGQGQARLELRRRGAVLEATVCQTSCAWGEATRLALPEPFAASPSEFTVVRLSKERHAGHLLVLHEGRRYEAVLAAPLTRGPADKASSTTPIIAYAGETGLSVGEAPDRSGTVIEILSQSDGSNHLVVGSVREDVNLCGRSALLVPQILHPDTLSMRRVKFHRIPHEERKAAPVLQPAPLGSRVPGSVFTPLLASSAKGSPAALSDGDLSTIWTENRGGDGSGEFIVMRAPRGVGLTGLLLSVPPQYPAGYAPPQSLWVATEDKVFKLQLDGEPASNQWYIPFPEVVNTTCLAIALDTAREPEGGTDGSAQQFDVGLAELSATTDVDEARLNKALNDLDTGGDEAAAAERVLIAVGQQMYERVKKRYPGYSQSGRMRALNVMDAAPCEVAVPAYVHALYSDEAAEIEHAKQRLNACQSEAVPALSRRLPEVGSARARALSSMLVHLDPARAVEEIAPLLSGGSRDKRRVLRQAFATAAADRRAAERIRALLSQTGLAATPGLAVMRALGERLPEYKQVAIKALRTWLPAEDFETRYLIVEPAARLAAFDRLLASHLARLLSSSPDPALRAHVAGQAPALPALLPQLTRAISDPHVRVREAAVVNLGQQNVEAARPALLQRLWEDPWPFVRAAAVRALGKLTADPDTNSKLAESARRDDSASVRRPALHVLGQLGATSHTDVVRAAFKEDADMHVRATAASTLGVLCDRGMVQELTEHAQRFATLSSTEAERIVGKASLSALGRLAPSDLQERLSPFFAAGVPRDAQSAATAALSHPNRCTFGSQARASSLEPLFVRDNAHPTALALTGPARE